MPEASTSGLRRPPRVRRAAGRTGRRRRRRPASLRPVDHVVGVVADRRARRSAPVRSASASAPARRRSARSSPAGTRPGRRAPSPTGVGAADGASTLRWSATRRSASSATSIDESGVAAIASSDAPAASASAAGRRPRHAAPVRRHRSTRRRRATRLGHHHRHRAGGRRQVDVLVGLAERRELGDHVDGHEPGPLERLQQAVAAVDQLLDLLAGQVAAPGQLAEHPLAVGAGLLDHLPALLLGHRQLGLGVGGGVAAPARRLELGLLAEPLGLVGASCSSRAGAVLGLDADRRCRPRGPSGRCAPSPRRAAGDRRVVVEPTPSVGALAGARPQLALEEALALLQAGQLGGDHAQEVADLAAGRTRGAPCRTRRRRPPPATTGRDARTRWPRGPA